MASGSTGKRVAYWLLTGLVVASQGFSGFADLAGFEPIREGVTALGYPEYVLLILGPAKIAGVIVLAVPGLLRLKEWAYAGFVIDFLGASLSHTLNGDAVGEIMPAVVALCVVLGSYFLRPENRRLAPHH